MSIKRKLVMGAASAALGISLIGGGTWAAFNDIAKINNQFTAGTLNLEVVANTTTQPINIDLSNMKPGDSVERVFKLTNPGSLAIKEVLLSATASGFEKGLGTNEDPNAFLDQFEIDFFKVDKENPVPTAPEQVVNVFQGTINLNQLVNETFDFNKIKDNYEAEDGSKRINLAPLANVVTQAKRGIPAGGTDSDEVHVKITFKKDQTRTIPADPYSEYVQNKYQGNKVKFSFDLEATQWAGTEVRNTDANGTLNNGVQGSADDTTVPTTQPSTRTIPGSTITNIVVD